VKHGALRPGRERDLTGTSARPTWSEGGQSLTELALILPVLLLLTVIALDFGRIYLGYVNLQNMARIAANYAANNPLAWGTTPDTAVQERYQNQIIEDATASNCRLPSSGGHPVVPDPRFTDVNEDGTTGGLGDTVTVQLNCSFQVLTPLIANILGGTVAVSAESNFPVKAGMTAVIPAGGGSGGGGSGGGGGVTAPPNAAFVADSSVFSDGPDPEITVTGPSVVVDFRDASGGGPATRFAWEFGDGGTSADQDVAHAYTCSLAWCAYLVTMTASNSYGQSSAYMQVTVIGNAEVNFTATPQGIQVGQTVTFTDTSTPGGTTYAWTFGEGAPVSGTATTVTHTYGTAGTYTATLTVTYPSPIGVRPPVSRTITVTPGYCTVPSLTNVHLNSADAIWQGSPYNFTGSVKRATGAPIGNFKITAQSIASGNGATALCTSDVYVSAP
jgi:PKD repeat protein/Flp pilus assembly protein TadG